MRAVTLVLAVLAFALGAFATPALAGGWAVTTFDALPGEFVAGQEYTLGYTIRQHGQTAINVDKTEILAVATSGRTLSSPGTSQGAVGHYVASVLFPAGGTYTWQVTQGMFAVQELGTLTVLAAAGASTTDKAIANEKSVVSAAAAPAAPTAPGNDPVRTALPFAAAAAAALFLWRLVTMLRATRRTGATA
ncbi:MAG: hypothetical protein WEE03_08670 [Chloroflexota bacterium]